ncbi:piggyBac transposable element-derived protein 4-like [Corythoichthys intestinalis]|uniref:piggyBac transposable element-derived protein 4-like n=1 Tax=Corythoichthys intestinalis TaxID=161448 RepID=UPI0025A50234|nr:piggyBac transposable element-derived protein 4-like [Corythoichthys intestinalis]XP_057696037.1 piggyBac transposable element-derived protein 4-like [Corythoichthys intestinalis]XP_057696039.1 piggyBac transposable element-derived protein 4-like [Corythoichthys intestinalis]
MPQISSGQKTLEMVLSEVDPVTSDGEEMEPFTSGEEEEEDDGEENTALPPAQKKARLEACTGSEQTAKDGTVWHEQNLGCPLPHSPVECYSADGQPTIPVRQKATTRLESFLCFITPDMLQSIQRWTVRHGKDTEDNWFLSVSELMAFIAIIFLRGITKLPALRDAWSEKLGNPGIMMIMSRNRFQDIMRHLRFDDKETRAKRVEKDRFAAISDLWSCFVTNCISSYDPGRHINVDEQLLPTRTRCSFLQYVPTKPDKFGIKFWAACDLKTKYVCNMIPYLGKDLNRPSEVRPERDVVMQLMEPFLDQGRTVTTDHVFTSMELAKQLLERKTNLIGAIKRIRRELPESTLDLQQYSTQVFSTPVAALTVYAAKRKKPVYILSTMHDVVETNKTGKMKPNTLLDYNKTKCGVDAMDQIVRSYTVRAGTRRWPVAVFYNMLDIAALNAQVLHQACTGVNERRVDFLVELASELADSHLVEQSANVKNRPRERPATPEPGKRVKCQVKSRCNSNNTTMRCVDCSRFTCGKCRKELVCKCNDCAA